jgi:hypothetical protein
MTFAITTAGLLTVVACDGVLKGGEPSDAGADLPQQTDQAAPGPDGPDGPVTPSDGVTPQQDSPLPAGDGPQPNPDSKPPPLDSKPKADTPTPDATLPTPDAPQAVDASTPTGDGPTSPCGSKCCTQPLPPEAQLVNTSNPKAVVGTGTAASCTYAALSAAIAQGGTITFNCGAAPVTISVTATLDVPTDRDTVIDGGNVVTLDGGGSVRILRWDSPGWMTNTHVLTLQRISLANGKATPTQAIPPCPTPCSQGWTDGQGGAVYMRDGTLRVINSTFTGNQAAPLGPDTGGGAIYVFGGQPLTISGSIFKNNQASNAGAVGTLFAADSIYNSLFDGNKAIGNGANNVDPSQCSCSSSGQIGSGGNGGAIYSDGVGLDVNICGTTITNNTANEFGAAVFFTSNDPSNKGTLNIRDSTLSNNKGNGIWQAAPGISTNANFPTPINTTITP